MAAHQTRRVSSAKIDLVKKLFYLLTALFLLALPTTVTAEQITAFDVIIDIQTDGQIQVTEKIL